jgi:hypothetical protein
MARSRNVTGTAYALTVFTPIVPGQEELVQAHIEALPTGADSPLARLEQLHTARVQIFDQPVFQGPGQKKPDRLESTYLVFTSSFDGDRDAYLDAICERLPAEADGWWRHCVGYPGTADRAAFKRYIDHNQIDTALFASAYPRASVSYVRDSLALRDRLVDFAADAQGLDAATLQERFLTTFSGADA